MREQTKRLDELLIKHGGNRELVAAEMGVTGDKLNSLIHSSPTLKYKWATSKSATIEILSSADTIVRDPLPIPDSDKSLAVACAKADDQFRDGLKGLKLREDLHEYAASLQLFHKVHFNGILDMISGGMAKAALEVMMQIEKLSIRLQAGSMIIEEEEMLWDAFHRACENLMKMQATAQDGALIRARIEGLKRDTQEGARKKGKPGFTPQLAVNISANNVEVKES